MQAANPPGEFTPSRIARLRIMRPRAWLWPLRLRECGKQVVGLTHWARMIARQR